MGEQDASKGPWLFSSAQPFKVISYVRLSRRVFWHQEVASGPFCFLVNSSWLLVFILLVFSFFISAFILFFFGLIICFHYWFRDLLRELLKKYEVLLIILFLGFLIFLISEGLLFVSFFWTSFHSLSSPSLGLWPGEAFYVPDPVELTFANTLLLSNAAIS